MEIDTVGANQAQVMIETDSDKLMHYARRTTGAAAQRSALIRVNSSPIGGSLWFNLDPSLTPTAAGPAK